MNKSPRLGISSLALIAAATVAFSALAVAQVKKGKTRPLTTSQLMKGLVKPQCDAIKKGLEATSIADEGWAALATSAALLNESTYTLMDDDRCPDSVWSDATIKSMRAGTMDLLKAIEKKDQAAAKTAFGTATKSCKGCHDKHKSK